MRKDRLARRIIWHMTAWGFAGGAGVGLLYSMLVFSLVMRAYPASITCLGGLIFGGLVGGSLGLLIGFVLAGLTHMALRSRMRVVRYRAIVYTASALLTGTGALLGFSWFYPPFDWGWILFALIPALIAVVVAAIATVRVVGWVEITTSSLRVE